MITGRDLERIRFVHTEFEEGDNGSPAVLDIDLVGFPTTEEHCCLAGPLARSNRACRALRCGDRRSRSRLSVRVDRHVHPFAYATVELRYSPRCRTARTRGRCYPDFAGLGYYANGSYRNAVYATGRNSGARARTAMLNDAGLLYKACVDT